MTLIVFTRPRGSFLKKISSKWAYLLNLNSTVDLSDIHADVTYGGFSLILPLFLQIQYLSDRQREREGQQMLFLLLREGPTKDVMIVETREREGGQIEKFSVGGSFWKDTSDMFERGSEGGKNSIFYQIPC